jgi:hypothetical protein
VGRNAALSLRRTKVEGNKASNRGGGVVLGSEIFNVVQVRAAVQSNQAGNVAPDVFVVPTKMFTTNSRTVERFVSRLNSDEGLVDVTLRVMGAQDLPSEGIPIAARIDDVVLATAKSGLDGLAHLLVKLRKPPGTSRWAARGLVILRYATLNINVSQRRKCWYGCETSLDLLSGFPAHSLCALVRLPAGRTMHALTACTHCLFTSKLFTCADIDRGQGPEPCV